VQARSVSSGPTCAVGTDDTIKTLNANLPIDEGFPAYFPEARAYVSLIDTSRQQFFPGFDDTGDGTALNVRALYQRCPHLGCKPNPCLKNFWFECPCHGSRYDRLGIKAAPRGLDRFSVSVGNDGVLTIDTGRITLGPLPIAVGQPGIIPPRTPTGCI
jgi:cytochrome b6-f complex iron-sulfur subunit